MINEVIHIRAFKAIDEPDTCQEFINGHVNVLKAYGINSLISANGAWFSNPNVYCVIAEVNKKLVGGVRMHKVAENYPLPAEDSLSYADKNIHDVIKKHAKLGAGEACGLWNSKEVAGIGIGFLLSKAIIIISDQLELERAFALSSDHTTGMFRLIGFRVIRSLGKNGDFDYPTPKYVSRLLVVNAKTLSYASPYNKQNMFSLRKNPVQTLKEQGTKGLLDICYNLKL